MEKRKGSKKKTSAQASVSTVILNYNGQKHLAQFLPSVTKTACPNHSIVIADNGSTDSSISFLQKNYPHLEVIKMQTNSGFAEGYNIALRQVESDYLVLLNSDVEVTPNWLSPIINYLEENPTVAAVQPKILSYSNKTHFEHAGAAGGYLDTLAYPFCRGRVFETCETDEHQYDTIQEVFWASGAALVVRKSVFHQLGELDGDYFAHMEEIDWCWRAKRAGYQIMAYSDSVVYHVGGGTLAYESPRKVYLNFRNSLFTLYKNEPISKLLYLLPLRLVLDGVAGLKFALSGSFSSVWAIVKAHWHFFFSIGKWTRKRRYYNALIQEHKIAEPNLTARYGGSIIWAYYVRGKKKFGEIVRADG